MKHLKVLTALFVLLSAFPVAHAAEPLVIPLWERGAPGFENRRDEPEENHDTWVRNIHNPSLTAYFPEKDKANGTAVLICPGGGHSKLVFKSEGYEPAQYFNHLGVTAFVLKYRLARDTNSPYSLKIHPRQDAQRAMRLIRSRATEWNLNTNRIGAVGFSAGGEVVSLLAYSPAEGDPASADAVDRFACTTDFQIIVYPGPLGIPEEAPTNAPPAFFIVANDDASHVGPVMSLVAKYREAHRPFELYLLEAGGHGFNMGARSKFAAVKHWPERMTDWLTDRKFIPGAPQ